MNDEANKEVEEVEERRRRRKKEKGRREKKGAYGEDLETEALRAELSDVRHINGMGCLEDL